MNCYHPSDGNLEFSYSHLNLLINISSSHHLPSVLFTVPILLFIIIYYIITAIYCGDVLCIGDVFGVSVVNCLMMIALFRGSGTLRCACPLLHRTLLCQWAQDICGPRGRRRPTDAPIPTEHPQDITCRLRCH